MRHKVKFVGAFAIAVGLTAVSSPSRSGDRGAIWKVIHDRCLVNEQKSGNPNPCIEVHKDMNGRPEYAILRDLKGTAHYLIIPTTRLSGIESDNLLKNNAENWFDMAWEARHYLDQAVRRAIPRDQVALAVNSVGGRGQDQLHIHLSCILPSVAIEIADQMGSIDQHWSGQTIHLGGHRYFARLVATENLSDVNPFKLVANQIPDAKRDMSRMTIMIVGSTAKSGRGDFLLFAGRSDEKQNDRGKAEDLLDVNCERK